MLVYTSQTGNSVYTSQTGNSVYTSQTDYTCLY